MTAITRYALLVILLLLLLHLTLLGSHQGYRDATSFTRKVKSSTSNATWNATPPLSPGNQQVAFLDRKANATIVMLARNKDMLGVINSMKQMEDRFNKRFQYPWTFLNDEPFTAEFKRWTSAMTDQPCEYGLIGSDQWGQPAWINETRAAIARDDMLKGEIIYGGSVKYRNMCRYNSGFFFQHPLLLKYRYYWRVEPGIRFYCDLDFDPLLYMQDQGKVYGFTITLFEYVATIQSLWSTVKEFIKQYPYHLHKNNAMKFISNDGGDTYNLCHFWSNFEIADLDFWRSEAYARFFDVLDRSGGFYYERWGDAPVHSIAAALLADRDQLHFFNEIGYRHEPFEHCPSGELHERGKCWCSVADTFDSQWYSCLAHFEKLYR